MNPPRHRSFIPLLALLAGLALAGGCNHPTTGTSYIAFAGGGQDVTAKLDGRVVHLTGDAAHDRIEVKPGLHHVHVEKAGTVVADRDIYCGDRQVLDVPIP